MSFEADVVTALQVKEGLVGIVNIRPEQQCLSKQKEDLADCAEISLQDQQGVCVLEMVPLVSLVVLGMSGDFFVHPTHATLRNFCHNEDDAAGSVRP